MNKQLAAFAFVASLSATTTLWAADPADIPPPPPPAAVQSGETLEPEVSIIDRDGKRIEEYSVNGRVYAAKITPKSGPPYYLIDSDGDGLLDTRHSDIERTPEIPRWVLFSW